MKPDNFSYFNPLNELVKDRPRKAAIIIIALFVLAMPAFAVDQMKTIQSFVGDSDVAISSQVDRTFSIYIGDNISGVTDPVKSYYFVVSGVYTGGVGSIDLRIDSDAATSKAFTLPAVTSPTPFEILYKDTGNKINPASAGTYSYTLNIIPSSVTIYGLGAKLVSTHRYVPASCDDGQPTNEKIKTTHHFVGDSDASVINTTVNTQFSIYIGDNLSGVTNPIKSVHFTVSGVYTSSAVLNLGLQIDSDAATLQNFSLPSVSGTPTPFEILYKDTTSKINPSSAGTYTYTLNIIVPSGMTIYGLGAVVTTTYRYKPPTCAGGMPIFGELTSTVFETTGSADGPAYNSIMWKGSLGTGNAGKVRFQLATSASATGPWTFKGGGTCSTGDWYDPGGPDTAIEIGCVLDHNNNRYFRYKVQICSNDCNTAGTSSPTVNDVVVNWSP